MRYFILCLLFGISLTTSAQKLSLWATWYYVPVYAHTATGVPLLNEGNQPTGVKLDSCDWCSACIEGTVLVRKEEKEYLYTYAGRSSEMQFDCRKCVTYKQYAHYEKTGQVLWTLSEGYGTGAKNYKLVPYRTLAVDPKVITIGTVLYIAAADGVMIVMDNGQTWVHDGYFFAGDVGSAIQGNHVDVFTGKNKQHPFAFVSSNVNAPFEARVEKDVKVVERLRKMHE